MIIAGTGHRPNKLGGYSDEVGIDLVVTATDWLASGLRNQEIGCPVLLRVHTGSFMCVKKGTLLGRCRHVTFGW